VSRDLERAFDEARFGPARTLNLRALRPTPEQAVAHAEAWLRERQASGVREVLVVTGRGNQSVGGVSPVSAAVSRLLAALRRRGVVKRIVEHTPGSFAVELAPLSALREAPPRRRERASPPAIEPTALAGLDPATRTLLREVALRALEELGVHDPGPFLEQEMLAQLAYLAPAVPEAVGREERLREMLRTILAEYDDR